MISEDIQDQAALYALELLDAGEAAAFERALAADGELRTLAVEMSEAAATLALAEAGHAAPTAGLKSRVLAAVIDEAQGNPMVGEVVAGPNSWTRWVPWAAAAALAVCCGVLATLSWKAMDESIGQGFARISAERRVQTAEAELASVRAKPEAPDALQRVSYCPLGPVPAIQQTGPQAAVLWDAMQRRGRLQIQKLPSAGSDKDYQLWAVEAGHKNPINAGVVKLDADGGAAVEFRPGDGDDAQAAVTAFALSVERAGGVPQNEGPILFVGKLSP